MGLPDGEWAAARSVGDGDDPVGVARVEDIIRRRERERVDLCRVMTKDKVRHRCGRHVWQVGRRPGRREGEGELELTSTTPAGGSRLPSSTSLSPNVDSLFIKPGSPTNRSCHPRRHLETAVAMQVDESDVDVPRRGQLRRCPLTPPSGANLHRPCYR